MFLKEPVITMHDTLQLERRPAGVRYCQPRSLYRTPEISGAAVLSSTMHRDTKLYQITETPTYPALVQ